MLFLKYALDIQTVEPNFSEYLQANLNVRNFEYLALN